MITRLTTGLALSFGLLAAWPAHSSQIACAKYFASAARVDIQVERRADQPPALQRAIDAYLRTLAGGDSRHVMAAQAEAIARTWQWLAMAAPEVFPETRPSLSSRRSLWTVIPQRVRTWPGADGSYSRDLRRRLGELREWRRSWTQAFQAGAEAIQHDRLAVGWRALVSGVGRLQAALRPPAPRSEEESLVKSGTESVLFRLGERLLRSVPGLLVLADFEPYSIRDLNDLSPFPIYLVGFVDHVESADGLDYWPLPFLEHDLDHALRVFEPTFQVAIAKLRDGTWSRARFRRYVAARAFVYWSFRRMVERAESAATRTALDIVWHQIYREEARHEMSGEGLLRALRESRRDVESHHPRGLEGRIRYHLITGFFGQDQEIRAVQPRDVADALTLLEEFASALPAWAADASLLN